MTRTAFCYVVTAPAKKANLMPGARYILSRHKTSAGAPAL
jgi:hypothetical protein